MRQFARENESAFPPVSSDSIYNLSIQARPGSTKKKVKIHIEQLDKDTEVPADHSADDISIPVHIEEKEV